jgi:hypothetical protein
MPRMPCGMRCHGGAMPYSLTEAAVATGHNRSAIWKAIKRGTLSASRDAATGRWQVEAAELHRVFPAAMPPIAQGTAGNGEETAETTKTAVLRAQLEAERARAAVLEGVVDDLRRRLDAESEERRRLTMVLADMRTPAPMRRAWWPWARRA